MYCYVKIPINMGDNGLSMDEVYTIWTDIQESKITNLSLYKSIKVKIPSFYNKYYDKNHIFTLREFISIYIHNIEKEYKIGEIVDLDNYKGLFIHKVKYLGNVNDIYLTYKKLGKLIKYKYMIMYIGGSFYMPDVPDEIWNYLKTKIDLFKDYLLPELMKYFNDTHNFTLDEIIYLEDYMKNIPIKYYTLIDTKSIEVLRKVYNNNELYILNNQVTLNNKFFISNDESKIIKYKLDKLIDLKNYKGLYIRKKMENATLYEQRINTLNLGSKKLIKYNFDVYHINGKFKDTDLPDEILEYLKSNIDLL